jgi:hypothetical protein
MSQIKLDIPDLTVVVNTGDTYKVVVDTPATITATTASGYLTVADYASSSSYALVAALTNFALTASYAENASQASSAGPLETVFFVTQEGSDTDIGHDGRTIFYAFRTIKKATQAATAYMASGSTAYGPRKVTIRVKSGYYVESAPITVPAYTSILGDDLRSVVVRPTDVTSGENLFLMNNGTYAYGLRLEGCVIDDLENPRKGFFFAFAPSASITTSPYIQNCTAARTPVDKFYAPLASGSGNPEVGNGPGGMIVDDSVLDPYSPLKSMIVDAYTQVAFNGIGICLRGSGYGQMVSFFTNFSRAGVYCIDGGHASLLNSNTTFGDYGIRAKGSRILVVPDKTGVSTYTSQPDADILKIQKTNILNYMIGKLQLSGSYSASYLNTSSHIYTASLKDGGLLLDSIATDLLSEQPGRIVQFTQGLFKAQDTSVDKMYTLAPTGSFVSGAIAAFRVNDGKKIAMDFTASYGYIRDYIVNDPDSLFGALTPSGLTKIQQLINIPKNTITSAVIQNLPDLLQLFGSLATSTSHDFSYAGSGVNFLALPVNQGGIGETNVNLRIVEEDGGRVFHTSGDETGDFYAGSGFIIRQATGIIEGRTFNKAIAARFTPLNLALES